METGSFAERMKHHYDGKKSLATNRHAFLRPRRLYATEGLAALTLSHESVHVCEAVRLVAQVRVGAQPLPAGSRIAVSALGYNPFSMLADEADEAADAEGRFARVRADGPQGLGLRVTTEGRGFTGRTVTVELTDGALMPDDTLRIVIGENGTLRISEIARDVVFHLEIAFPGDEGPGRLVDRAALHVEPGELHSISCIVPPTGAAGVAYDLRLLARDRYLNPVDAEVDPDWTATDRLTGTAGGLSPGDSGARRFRGAIRALQPGVHRLRGRDRLSGREIVSNPLVAGAADGEEEQYLLCFGDIHCHDHLSPGLGSTVEYYRNARRLGLDFLALPIQTHGGNLDEDRWTISTAMAEEFYRPGEFVTFPAFEWQHYAFGHKNVYYRNADQPFLSPYDERTDTAEKLFEALRRSDALVIAHHIAYALDCHVPGTDWEFGDEELQPVVELCSVHGACETADGERPLVRNAAGPYWREVLSTGVHLGVIGGSDSHTGQPVNGVREPRPYPGGMACVYAETRTRDGIFDALRARRCYATTGARIVLRFRIDKHEMGEVVTGDCSRPRTFEVFVAGTAPISSVVIVKNGVEVHTVRGDGPDLAFEYTDPPAGQDGGGSAAAGTNGPISGSSGVGDGGAGGRSDGNGTNGANSGGASEDWYYVKVVQADGELAWSSPIWVSNMEGRR